MNKMFYIGMWHYNKNQAFISIFIVLYPKIFFKNTKTRNPPKKDLNVIDKLYNTMFFSVDIDLVYILINFSKMQKKKTK